VLEFVLEAAGQGVIGLIVTAPLIAAARRYKQLRDRMKDRGAGLLVNRAGAALLALEDVRELNPCPGRLWIESAEEMSTVAGRPSPELNYVGADSWLVLVVDLDRRLRHVRTVSPSGEITGRITAKLSDLERVYLPAPE
jgi:hypothetical protein